MHADETERERAIMMRKNDLSSWICSRDCMRHYQASNTSDAGVEEGHFPGYYDRSCLCSVTALANTYWLLVPDLGVNGPQHTMTLIVRAPKYGPLTF